MTSASRTPRVTVLMPVYNAAAYVADAARSILHQTWSDFELLVIDDGSTDDSARIVASLGDPRIRLVRADRNIGLTATLNKGLALARGALIARQDADDLSEPERLERQVAFLDANPAVALVGSWYRKIDAAGRLLGDRRLPTHDAPLRWALLSHCPIVHSAAMFRRDAIAEAGGYDDRFAYAQDYELWSRVAGRHRLANLPEFLVRYRVIATSLTATIGDSSGEGARISLANVRELMNSAEKTPPSPGEHAAVCALLLGEPFSLGSGATADAFAHACAVLDAFSTHTTITAREIAGVRADVLRFLRRRFVQSADYFTPSDFERVAGLLYDHTSWTRLLRGRGIRSALAAVGRSRVGRAIAGDLRR